MTWSLWEEKRTGRVAFVLDVDIAHNVGFVYDRVDDPCGSGIQYTIQRLPWREFHGAHRLQSWFRPLTSPLLDR